MGLLEPKHAQVLERLHSEGAELRCTGRTNLDAGELHRGTARVLAGNGLISIGPPALVERLGTGDDEPPVRIARLTDEGRRVYAEHLRLTGHSILRTQQAPAGDPLLLPTYRDLHRRVTDAQALLRSPAADASALVEQLRAVLDPNT